MRILLTNDDGIHAPGIVALFDALTDAEGKFGGPLLAPDTATRSPRSTVFPIAPLTVQSATSHGVTFNQPLMTKRITVNERMRGIAVDARPADWPGFAGRHLFVGLGWRTAGAVRTATNREAH